MLARPILVLAHLPVTDSVVPVRGARRDPRARCWGQWVDCFRAGHITVVISLLGLLGSRYCRVSRAGSRPWPFDEAMGFFGLCWVGESSVGLSPVAT